jgi:2,4-dienoyl-CoA reductase-like NADH-dependent reductase (Old Yellow Enzyme family)
MNDLTQHHGAAADDPLFTPVDIGGVHLQNRTALAP